MPMLLSRITCAVLLAAGSLPAATGDDEFFESRVRPVLAANCYACHTNSAMGGLRLDSRDAMLKGGKSGPAVAAGKPDESLLIQAVRRTHERLKMPPTAPLDADKVTALVEWVKRGATWPDAPAAAGAAAAAGPAYKITPEQRAFWSFQPVRKAALPNTRHNAAQYVRTPVDRFVLAQLEAKGLEPVAEADRRTWLRRVTLSVTGLPPTPEEVDAFLADKSEKARATVVERLLASPHYGERWGRHWLDLARYSDGQLAAGADTPFPNAHRYRDWVVDAFNKDLPYDRFVKAQIAADLLPESERAPLLPGLGFQALGSRGDDQVDVTTKVFLGLTVGCAQCHDHKYDPIPTRDYYSMVGIFRSSVNDELPLVEAAEVARYKAQKKKIDAVKETIDDYIIVQQRLLVDTLARHTARYMVAAWKKMRGEQPETIGLDYETLDRWVNYLKNPEREHPYMKPWFDLMAKNPTEEQVKKAAAEFQEFVLTLIEDAKEVDDKNYVAFGGRKGMKNEATRQYTNIVALPVLKFYQWRELASGPYNIDGFRAPAGIYYYSAKELDRWMGGFAREHVEQLRAEMKVLEKDLPPMYPFLHSLKDADKPADAKVAIRGDAKTLGEVAPRGFLQILAKEPKHFEKGSGRLELAQAIASPDNPLTARVIVNRIWQHHFGHGIVRTPSNFGQMGERPTHPELLDYLAARLVDSGWSLKAIHREILLSRTYALASSGTSPKSDEIDPDNRLLWRANVRPRLDLEALRDSVLAVTGKLDRAMGGLAKPLADDNYRRTLYLTVSRGRLDPTMGLFDFPDANATTDERALTVGPLQGLFFLNSQFVSSQAKALAERLEKEAGVAAPERIQRAYRLLFGRTPDADELKLGINYVAAGGNAWPQYLQALLGSGEFTSVN